MFFERAQRANRASAASLQGERSERGFVFLSERSEPVRRAERTCNASGASEVCERAGFLQCERSERGFVLVRRFSAELPPALYPKMRI